MALAESNKRKKVRVYLIVSYVVHEHTTLVGCAVVLRSNVLCSLHGGRHCCCCVFSLILCFARSRLFHVSPSIGKS